MTELVLLVEPVGLNLNGRLRPVFVHIDAKEIIERNGIADRLWRCADGERALTGQRIFREVLPVIPEEPEQPLYDELVLKTPLQLHGDETPLGFRREHLRKHKP